MAELVHRAWRDVAPSRRAPYDCLGEDGWNRLERRLVVEARQLVLARRGVAALYAAMADTRDGTIVNGDMVNQLLPLVQENPTLGLAALHAVGLEVLMDLFKVFQWVEERALDLGKGRPVLVTMGGQASGKTSLATFATGVGAILDAPHTDAKGLVMRLGKLLGQGREVWLVWVHRNPRHALHSMLLRAVEEGRPVVLAQMAKAHHQAPLAFAAVAKAFRGQCRLHLYHAWNLGSPEQVRVLGGRLDREGKDALDILKDLPAWSESDFLACLLDGYAEALAGERGWGDTLPARDLVCFLNAKLSEEELNRVGAALRPDQAQSHIGAPSVAGKPTSLSSPLVSPILEPQVVCTMLGDALREGIRWNQGRLAEAFQHAYGVALPQASRLFD